MALVQNGRQRTIGESARAAPFRHSVSPSLRANFLTAGPTQLCPFSSAMTLT